MKKNHLILLLTLGLCIFITWLIYNSFREWECCDYTKKFKKANEIIQKVERYKKKNGVLPNSLEDIGEKTTMDGPFYNKIDPKEYEVWFGTYLGESCVYRSKIKKWTPY